MAIREIEAIKEAIDSFQSLGSRLDEVEQDLYEFNLSGTKYLREIKLTEDNKIDVYAVLLAFNVTCPARQHAIKKLLCAGLRGKNDVTNDLKEAKDAIERAIELI